MKFGNAILAILWLLLFWSCSHPPVAETAKGSLFIIGGGSRSPELVARMIEESGLLDSGYVLILPMASSEADSAIVWSSEQFREQGLSCITGINFKKDTTPTKSQLDSVRNASLIYISGGDQNAFMDIVKDTPIEEAIHEAYQRGAMIAGTSAGAAVMSRLMITGNELKNTEYRSTFPTIEAENLEIKEGLGFLQSAIVDQHFIMRSRHNRLLTAVIENPGITGVGIDESTAILVRNGLAEVVGDSQVMVFANPDNSKTLVNGKLGAHNIHVDVLLPGEIFPIH